MKKYVLLVTCWVLSIAIYGQSADPTEPVSAKFSNNAATDEKVVHYGIHVTPKIATQLFVGDKLIDAMKSYEISLGVDVFYDLSERVQLKSGLNYTAISLREIDYSPTFPGDGDGSGGHDPYKSWYEDKRKGHFIGIPVEVKMKLIGEVNHLYGKLGAETMFRVGSSSQSVVVESGTKETEIPDVLLNDFSPVLFKVNLGVGYEFALASRTKMYVEPVLEYGVNKTFVESDPAGVLNNNSHLLNFGLMLGVNF